MISKDESKTINSTAYEFGEFRFEAGNLLLFKDSEIVPLAPKTGEVLLALVEAGGKLITKQELLDRVWADTFVEEANLTQHISALRKALGEDKNGRKFIETIPRKGYRFVAEVEKLQNTLTEITISEQVVERITEKVIVEADAGIRAETKAIAPPKKKNYRLIWLTAAAISVFVVTIIGLAVQHYKSSPATFKVKNTVRLTSGGRVKYSVISPDGKFVIYAQEEPDERQSLRARQIGSDSDTQIVAPAEVAYKSLNITPDGNSIYYIDGQGTLYRMPSFGGIAEKIASGLFFFPTLGNQIAVSPDGRQIAFVRRSEGNQATTLFIAGANGANERILRAFEPPVMLNQNLAWSRDGKNISCHHLDNGKQNILSVRVADGEWTEIYSQTPDRVAGDTVWLSDSNSLLMDGRGLSLISSNGEAAKSILPVDSWEYYDSISLTTDEKLAVVVKTQQISNLWIMPSGDPNGMRQLTAGFQNYDGTGYIGFAPDGKIIYSSITPRTFFAAEIDTNSQNFKQLTKDKILFGLSPDGHYLIVQKAGDDDSESAEHGLSRVDLRDGSEKQLTSGADVWSSFSPDGKWLVYTKFGEHNGLWKVEIEGGEEREILPVDGLCPVVSPDGKTVAFALRNSKGETQIALTSFNGGEIIKTLNVNFSKQDSGFNKRSLQWTADGRSIYFLSDTNSATNIWRQPIDGSAPVQITNFKDGKIFNFVFSSDEKQIALSRGTINSDVILVENSD